MGTPSLATVAGVVSRAGCEVAASSPTCAALAGGVGYLAVRVGRTVEFG